jgi:hypothetical protein
MPRDNEIYLDYPLARIVAHESPDIFILDHESPLAEMYENFYPGTNISISLVTFTRFNFLLSFKRMLSMLPNAVTYNREIGYKADSDYNMDIDVVANFLADPHHNIKTTIINTGPHCNGLQFGGGLGLSEVQEIYHPAIQYITTTLEKNMRNDQVTFFRASSSGHSNGNGVCKAKNPLRELVRIKYFDWNWHGQETYNALWKTYLGEAHLQGRFEKIRYLDVSRPTMLRPDAVRSFRHFQRCVTNSVLA